MIYQAHKWWKFYSLSCVQLFETTWTVAFPGFSVHGILQAKLQQYVNWEIPEVQVEFEKAEEPEIKLSAFIG